MDRIQLIIILIIILIIFKLTFFKEPFALSFLSQDCSSISNLSDCSSNSNCMVSNGFCMNKQSLNSNVSKDILNPRQNIPDLPQKLAPGVQMVQPKQLDFNVVARDKQLAPGVRFVSEPTPSSYDVLSNASKGTRDSMGTIRDASIQNSNRPNRPNGTNRTNTNRPNRPNGRRM